MNMNESVYHSDERILIMTECYPFFMVGKIVEQQNDTISVKAEFGVPLPLKDRVFHIQKDSISAYYVEHDSCKIPTIW